MGVISLFPAGGGASLRVTAYAAAGNMPAAGAQGAIAVITASAIAAVYASAAAPASPAAGDVWVFLGGSSLAPVALSKSITLHPRAVYQYAGGAWALRVAYVDTGTAWQELALFVYDNGAEILSALQTAIASADTFYSTKLSGSLYFHASTAMNYGTLRVMTAGAVDLRGITAVRFKLVLNNNTGDASARVMAAGSTTAAVFDAALELGDCEGAGTLQTVSLDVSALDGAYYLGLDLFIPNYYSGAMDGSLYAIELVK